MKGLSGTGRAALVTGARRGIGLGIAKALLQEGYAVLLCGTTEEPQATAGIAEDLNRLGTWEYQRCDVSDAQDREALFARMQARFGRLDVLVNNAGVAPKQRLDVLETTVESYERLLRINTESCFFMCQAGARKMLEGKAQGLADYRPRIINISSISAYTSSTSRGEYCISKAGISMVTQLFADRLAGEGIPVFEVRPGIIQTDMTAGVADKYRHLIEEEGVTPIRRFGQPADVADQVLAACSGLLDFGTGTVLNADGGFHLRRL
ncbi:MAG: 3-ketoacyl-ACP reductase [Candidatus Spyradocola sp.]|jgi:3-oxoacyl-[acyl-carrier protein] reductase